MKQTSGFMSLLHYLQHSVVTITVHLLSQCYIVCEMPMVAYNHVCTGDCPPLNHQNVNGGNSTRLLSQEGVYQLTKDVRIFSEALTSLKSVFLDDRSEFNDICYEKRFSY